MELSQKDLDERAARIDAGNGSDEDARLVEHYRNNGWEPTKPDQQTGDDHAKIADTSVATEDSGVKASRSGRGSAAKS